MAHVHEKIQSLMQSCGWSASRTAREADLKYTTFCALMRNQSDPSLTTVEKLARAFGVPVELFSSAWPNVEVTALGQDRISGALAAKAAQAFQTSSNYAATNGKRVTLKAFLDWWASHSGRLEDFDQISQSVDLFESPCETDRIIKPLEVGRQSLATRYFELHETNHLIETLEGFSTETNEALVAAHMEALRRGEPVLSHPHLDERLRTGQRFARMYRRVMAPLFLPGGKTLLANYSEDIN